MSLTDHAESSDLPDYDEIEPNIPWIVDSTEPATTVSDTLLIASPSNVNNVKAAVPDYERVVQLQTLQSEVFTETREAQQTVRDARRESATVIDLNSSGEEYDETDFEEDAKYTPQLDIDDTDANDVADDSKHESSKDAFTALIDIQPERGHSTVNTSSSAMHSNSSCCSGTAIFIRHRQDHECLGWTNLLDDIKECRLGRCYMFGRCPYCQARNDKGPVSTKTIRLADKKIPGLLQGPLGIRMSIVADYSGTKISFPTGKRQKKKPASVVITGTETQRRLAMRAMINIVREFGWPGERYVMMKFKGASFKDTYRRKCNELLRHISAEHIHNFERLHVTLGQASTDVDPAVYYDYFKTTVFPILQQLVKKHKEPFSFRTGNSEDRERIIYPDDRDFFVQVHEELFFLGAVVKQKYRPHMTLASPNARANLAKYIPGLVFEGLKPSAIHISRAHPMCFDCQAKERITECWFYF